MPKIVLAVIVLAKSLFFLQNKTNAPLIISYSPISAPAGTLAPHHAVAPYAVGYTGHVAGKESSVHRNPYETHDHYDAIRTQDADLAVSGFFNVNKG